MDYMTEVAIDMLPIFAADPQTLSREHTRWADRVEELIDRYADGRRIWTEGSEQARLEMLVDVFYGFPVCAVEAVDLLGRFPPFIEDLARLETERDRKSKSGKASMFSGSAWFGREPEAPAERQRALIGDPGLVVRLAQELEMAVPFSMILQTELDEIARSRPLRMGPDEQARTAQLRRDLALATRALEIRATQGDEAARQTLGTLAERPPDVPGTPSLPPAVVPSAAGYEARTSEIAGEIRQMQATLEGAIDSRRARRKAARKSEPAITPPATGREAGAGDASSAAPAPAARATRGGRAPADAACRHPLRRAQEEDLFGMTFSGGGIRSATFNLGMLQGLAELDLLRGVDYLSTVSGGGYIGAWLVAWIKRHAEGGIRIVQQRLSPLRSPDPEADEVRPIRFLREYSNYLTPKVGFFSADTWTMIAVWFRNTMLNQLVLLLFLAGVLLVPRAIAKFLLEQQLLRITPVLVLIIGCTMIGLDLDAFDRRWQRDDLATPGRGRPPLLQRIRLAIREQWAIQWLIVGPVFTAAAIWSADLNWWMTTLPSGRAMLAGDWWWQRLSPESQAALASWAGWPFSLFGSGVVASHAAIAAQIAFVLLSVSLIVVQVTGKYYRCFYLDVDAPRGLRKWKATAAISATALFAGFVGGLLVMGFSRAVHSWSGAIPADRGPWFAVTFGPPVLVEVLALTVVVQLGLLGRNFPDERREWWSRLGAWALIYSLGWLGLFAISIFGPLWIAIAGVWGRSLAGAAWVGSTITGTLAGRSSASAGKPGEPTPSKWLGLATTVAPYVFVLGLLLLISEGLHLLLIAFNHPSEMAAGFPGFAQLRRDHWMLLESTAGVWTGWFYCAALLGAAFALAYRVDVNEFSMHHFYKNRLVRCYLGASRVRQRQPNPFTGFDRSDDIKLATLRVNAGKDGSYIGPYPLINTALNLVKGDDLAWQERKAESFSFTPYFSGYAFTNRRQTRKWDPAMTREGYRPTEKYAYGKDNGISVGTAASISGAAANPNMGYQSSPPMAFLMTMFNARLGWWLGNPRHQKGWLESSPKIGLIYLIKELTGSTNDRSRYVNLSDGGHFDNLGIYELVRRRCRYIIACDSEADRDLTFEGLGNVIRKVRTDFGVDIDVTLDQIRRLPTEPNSRAHCVVGDILYPDGRTGKLIYLKASLTGDEAGDVLEYSSRHATFPHEATADQWFDESQFESYRTLGRHVARIAFERTVRALPPDASTEQQFSYLENIWSTAGAASAEQAARHAMAYGSILEKVRVGADLGFLDGVLYPGLPSALTAAEAGMAQMKLRNGFYIYFSMIDLMANVFADLALEDPKNPHNAGWLWIFHQWASQPGFQQAWQIARETYGERFRRFCEREFKLSY